MVFTYQTYSHATSGISSSEKDTECQKMPSSEEFRSMVVGKRHFSFTIECLAEPKPAKGLLGAVEEEEHCRPHCSLIWRLGCRNEEG